VRSTVIARRQIFASVPGRSEHMADGIEVRGASFEYSSGAGHVLAVQDATFTVAPSEFLCIVGPSGCGKTTILNMLAGFLPPTRGEILIGGKRVGVGEAKTNRGVVFQDFAQLFPWRTARANVEFGLEMRGVGKAERRDTAMEFLRLVALEKFEASYPHQLSGGMQQRVAIARALAYNPGVLLMDEPFAALDAMTRDDMQSLVADVWARTRKTVVYITHNVAEAVFLGDKVIVMAAHPGTIRQEMRINIARPRDPLSDEFITAQRRVLASLQEVKARPRAEAAE
jgi:NitT/TauT family transport system ATP-binding protein